MKIISKRLLAAIMALTLIMSMLPLSVLAEDDVAHQHNYTSAVTQEATCGEAGVTTYTCDVEGCDRPTYTEPIAATGNHIYENGVCTGCGGAEPAAHQHNYTSAVTQEATCGEAGVTTYTCDVEGCDRPTYTEPIAATGNHSYKNGACEVCGEAEPVPMPAALYFSDQDKTWDVAMKVVYVDAENAETVQTMAYDQKGFFRSDAVPAGTVSFYFTDGTNKTASRTIEVVHGDGLDMCVIFDGGEEWMEFATWEQMQTGEETPTPVANVNGTDYTSLYDAMNNAASGSTVTLLDNLTIDTETCTIPDGKSVTLNMNGKKITVTDNKTSGNYELFYILGEMTVTGNGTIELTATTDRDWNALSAVFHNRGGVLTIQNGTFRHLGGTDMAFVVDNSGNYYGDATTNIQGGTLSSTYTAIRNRMEQNSHGASGKAILNISGGSISGTTSAVWAQAASTSLTSPATGEINVSGGSVGTINTARHAGAECMTTITGGTVAAFKGEVNELTVKDNGQITGTITMMDAEGNEVDFAITAEGLYTTAVAKVGDTNYDDLQTAIDNADGKTVIVLQEVETTETLNIASGKTVTIDLNEKTVKTAGIVNAGTLTVEDGEIVGGPNDTIRSTGTLTLNNVKATGTRHVLRIVSGTATINGGEYKPTGAAGTRHALNVGDEDAPTTNKATVTINSGTFIGPAGTTMDSGSAVCVQTGSMVIVPETSTAEFKGGKNATLSAQTGATLTVKGGIYDQDPSAYVAADYKAVQKSTNRWEIAERDYVAQIGTDGAKFESLEEAVAAAQDGNTITLLEDATLTAGITAAGNLTIDTDGNAIKGSNVTLAAAAGKTLTIKGLGVNGRLGVELSADDTAKVDAEGNVTVSTVKDSGSDYGTLTLLTENTETGAVSDRLAFVEPDTKLVLKSTSAGFDENAFIGEYMLDTKNADNAYSGTLNADDIYTWFRDHENVYVYGTNNTLTVVSSAFFDTCKRIYVDDSTVYLKKNGFTEQNVVAARGCTELEMKSAFLAKLTAGKHTVKFLHEIDGKEYTVTDEFWVKSSGSVADPTCPKTGDYIMIAVGVLGVSVAALAVLLIIRKKKS